MKLLNQMSYRAPSFSRPQPTLIGEESLGLWGVCFSWGDLDLSEKVLENIRIFVEGCLNQSEITNPFGYDESLSSLENALKSGCALANDVIYRLVNSSTLTSGVEGVVIVKKGKELALLQIGQPHVILKRNNIMLPLLTSLDFLPADLNSGAFLPHRLLGLHPTYHPHLHSFHYEKGDEIILLAHSLLPSALLSTAADSSPHTDLKGLFQQISHEFPQHPFWLSHLLL